MTSLRTGLLSTALAGSLVVQFAALYSTSSPGPSLPLPPHSDKVVHFLIFAAPAFLVRLLTPARWPLLVLVLHAGFSELYQGLVLPNRSGDWLDLLADLIGVALGWAAAHWWDIRGRNSA